MMRDCRVRLGKFTSQFELCKIGEKHSGCCGRWEGPLQEMYLCALLFSRKWEDELRMPPCCGLKAGIGFVRDDSAE